MAVLLRLLDSASGSEGEWTEMTTRLLFILVYSLLESIFFIWAFTTKDEQKKQTRLLYAIYFALCVIGKELAAVAIHTGAYPLWNNK